jgi:hypothetical protein
VDINANEDTMPQVHKVTLELCCTVLIEINLLFFFFTQELENSRQSEHTPSLLKGNCNLSSES